MSRILLLIFLAGSAVALAQTPQPQVSSKGPGYTLQANARAVLTDVAVTDRDGNPVRNLPESVFHIFDDKHPQKILSFEEHTGVSVSAAADTSAIAPHTFSNDFLLHPPPAFNVLVLDSSTIPLVDQMYLYEELTRFITELPAGQMLAIYSRGRDYLLPVQNFTSDHALLLAGLKEAIPVIQPPAIREFAFQDEARSLEQLSVYLSQYPGRKNVIWFTAGLSIFLSDDASVMAANYLRPVYDRLDAARIAIDPVDVRGPIVTAFSGSQHLFMQQEARATGGRAYFNTNALAQVSADIVAAGSNYYTLTYSPAAFHPDTKWHRVKVKIDGGDYQVSYRSGYYDDGFNAPPPPKRSRTLMRANGETVKLPSNRSEPIIFKVDAEPSSALVAEVVPGTRVSPTPPRKNEVAYTFRYTVPAAAFNMKNLPQGKQIQLGAGVLVFNSFGRIVSRENQAFTLTFNGDKLGSNPKATLSFDQQLNLRKGEDHIFVGIWDMHTGRLGTLQFPVTITGKQRARH